MRLALIITLEIWNSGNQLLRWQLRASFTEIVGGPTGSVNRNSAVKGEQQPGQLDPLPLHYPFGT